MSQDVEHRQIIINDATAVPATLRHIRGPGGAEFRIGPDCGWQRVPLNRRRGGTKSRTKLLPSEFCESRQVGTRLLRAPEQGRMSEESQSHVQLFKVAMQMSRFYAGEGVSKHCRQ